MKLWRIIAVSTATEQYGVEAETEEAAREQFMRGEYLTFHDLGHEDSEIVSCEEWDS